MKTQRLFLALFLFFLTSFIGCSSDSPKENNCIPITCQNGGVSNSNCGCDCPQGYSGANCSEQITPTKVIIKKFRIKYFSNTKSNGNYWDGILPSQSNYPDIFFILQNSSNTTIHITDTYFQDAVANGTNVYEFTPTTPIIITDVNNSYTINLCDLDNNSTYEIMHSRVFSVYSTQIGFAPTRTIGDTNIPFVVEIDFEYQWN